MNILAAYLLVLASIIVSGNALAAEPFNLLTCRPLLGAGRVDVKTDSETLELKAGRKAFSIPLESCEFSDRQLGKFACEHENDGVVTKISSRFFKKHYNYVKLSVVEDGKVKFASEDFVAQKYRVDGFSQDPECMVDNEYVDVR